MVALSSLAGAGWQFFGNNGLPLAGGKLYTYAAGTTTPLATYTSSSGATPHANPIVLDSAGRVPSEIWLTSSALYKFVLKTAADVEIWTKDNVPGIAGPADLALYVTYTNLASTAAGMGAALTGFKQAGTGAVAETVQSKLQERVSVKDFGAVGDGVTDDTAAIQAAFDSGAAYISFPKGTYIISDAIEPNSNTVIDARGAHIKFTGGNAVGHVCLIRSRENIEIFGGTWDSNFQGNDNTFAIGAISADQTQLGVFSNNINIHDVTVKNARHGGAHIPDPNDPANIGRGGGKGLTVQIGGRNIKFTNSTIIDCDIGVSFEGIEDFDGVYNANGAVNDILFADNELKNIRYMPFYLSGTPTTTQYYGFTTQARVENCTVRESAYGQTSETVPQNIADLFGVISCNGGSHYAINGLTVVNSSGKTTLVRGSQRSCKFSNIVAVIGGQLVDCINSTPYGGYAPKNGTSPYNSHQIDLEMLGAVELSGYLVNNNATYFLRQSDVNIRAVNLGNGTAAAISTSKYVNNLQSSMKVQITDRTSGQITQYDKGAYQDNVNLGTVVLNNAVLAPRVIRNANTFFHVLGSTGATAYSATVALDTDGTDAIQLLSDPTGSYTVTAGATAPTGTTGTNLKINVFYNSTDNSIYVENRLGPSLAFVYKEVW